MRTGPQEEMMMDAGRTPSAGTAFPSFAAGTPVTTLRQGEALTVRRGDADPLSLRLSVAEGRLILTGAAGPADTVVRSLSAAIEAAFVGIRTWSGWRSISATAPIWPIRCGGAASRSRPRPPPSQSCPNC